MNIYWRKLAVDSLVERDYWRATIELPPIASYVKNIVHAYFKR